MTNILSNFGVQWVLLIAQAVNFLILLYLLQRFLYKPILKVLEERRAKVAKSLADADEIEKRKAQTEEDRERELAKALKEATQIIEDAKKSATKIIDDAHQKAHKDIESMIQKGRQDIQTEREKMRTEIRQEISRLVVAGLKTVTGKVLTKKDQENILKQSIKEI